jgi:hypothetical protein
MLCHQPNCTISAVKIIKAKDYPGENPNGKEIHIRILGGHKIEVVEQFGGWRYVNAEQRKKWITQYEHLAATGKTQTQPGREAVVKFHLVDGEFAFLNQNDLATWEASFTMVNVAKELEGIARWSAKNPMKKKTWFQQVSGMLAKKQRERSSDQNIDNPPF